MSHKNQKNVSIARHNGWTRLYNVSLMAARLASRNIKAKEPAEHSQHLTVLKDHHHFQFSFLQSSVLGKLSKDKLFFFLASCRKFLEVLGAMVISKSRWNELESGRGISSVHSQLVCPSSRHMSKRMPTNSQSNGMWARIHFCASDNKADHRSGAFLFLADEGNSI